MHGAISSARPLLDILYQFLNRKRWYTMNRRKIILLSGIFLTLLLLVSPYLIRRFPLICKSSQYIYINFKDYMLILHFNNQGKLARITFRFHSPYAGVINGIKANEPETSVVAKLGKPYLKLVEPGENGVWYLFPAKNNGYLWVYFGKAGVNTMSFYGGNPTLPLGLRMGMKGKEVKQILGPPDNISTETERKGSIIFSLLFLVVFAFWGTIATIFIPRLKFKYGWLLSIITDSIVFGIVMFVMVSWAIKVENYVFYKEPGLHYLDVMNINLFKVFYSLPGFLLLLLVIGFPFGILSVLLKYATLLGKKSPWYLFIFIIIILMSSYILAFVVNFLSDPFAALILLVSQKLWLLILPYVFCNLFVVLWYRFISIPERDRTQ